MPKQASIEVDFSLPKQVKKVGKTTNGRTKIKNGEQYRGNIAKYIDLKELISEEDSDELD